MKEGDKIITERRRGRPKGSKDKNKRRRRRTMKEILADRERKRAQVKKRKNIREKVLKKYRAKQEKESKETCGVKIVALIVKVKGDSRVKIEKNEAPELAPCEELVCKITYEKNGIPVHSIFSEVRHFAEALIYCASKDLLHE
jgi:hypothetical protein